MVKTAALIYFLIVLRPLSFPLFPYTTLFRSLRFRRVRRGPRPPGAPARHQSGRGARRGPPGAAARGDRLDPRKRLRGVPLVSRQRGPDPVEAAVPAGGPRQRGHSRRGAAAAGLGT